MEPTPASDLNPGQTSSKYSYLSTEYDAQQQKSVLRTRSLHERNKPEPETIARMTEAPAYPTGSFQARLNESLIRNKSYTKIASGADGGTELATAAALSDTRPTAEERSDGPIDSIQTVANAIASKAATYGRLPMLREMITRLPNPNIRSTGTGKTLLHLAVEKGEKLELSVVLADARTDPHLANNDGLTPFQLAESLGMSEKAIMIKEAITIRETQAGKKSFGTRLQLEREETSQTTQHTI